MQGLVLPQAVVEEYGHIWLSKELHIIVNIATTYTNTLQLLVENFQSEECLNV